MVQPGIYKHYKGKNYEVLNIAKHSETMEDMVVYRQLYGDRGIWVRPLKMFEEVVFHEGKTTSRFQFLQDNPEVC